MHRPSLILGLAVWALAPVLANEKGVRPLFSGRATECCAQMVPAPFFVPEPVESSSLRPLFESLGVENSHWNLLVDGNRLTIEEYEVLYRILYRFRTLSKARIERLAPLQPSLEEVEADPDSHRCDVMQLNGSLKELETIDVPVEQVEQMQLEQFYRARIELANSGRLVDVYCRDVPEVWLAAAKAGRVFDEPVSTFALFLKLGETVNDTPVFAFASMRVAWHPDKVDSDLEVSEDLRRLAGLGMDIGLFDSVRQESGIEREDRECFHQMLHAVGGSFVQTERQRELEDSDLAGLINQPESQTGRIVTIRGTARRIHRIDVPADLEERFGISHYYEIDLLYYLKEGVVVYHSGDEKLKMNLYPFVYCCQELPQGMPEGDAIRETVEITGYYYKLYGYESELLDRRRPDSDSAKQRCPLFIGHGLEWIHPERKTEKSGTLLVGFLFVVVILGLWISVWWYHRSDRAFQRTTLERQFQPPENFSLDDIDLNPGESEK